MKQLFSSKTESLFVLSLIVVKILLVLWKNTSILPLVDVTYQLENAYRIYCGQIPYQDFLLVLTPGTYWIMAFTMKIFGKQIIVHTFVLLFFSILELLGLWLIIKKFNLKKNVYILALIIFTGYSIYPYPNYDSNSMTAMIFAFFFFVYYDISISNSIIKDMLLGILIVTPFFFKQNTGLVFIFVFDFLILYHRRFKFFWIFFSEIVIFLLFFLWLGSNHSLSEFYDQVFIFPGHKRNPLLASVATLKSYFEYIPILYYSFLFIGIKKYKIKFINFISLIPFLFLPAVCYLYNISYQGRPFKEIFVFNKMSFYTLIWPTIFILASLSLIYNIIKVKKISKFDSICIISILVSNASFLSQGYFGSSYGIYPLFIVMIAYVIMTINSHELVNKINIVNSFFVYMILIVALGVSFFDHSRLRYVKMEGAIRNSQNEYLKFIGTPGDWLVELDELLDFITLNIPYSERFVSIPGEDPLYYLTDREPTLEYFQLNANTYLYDEGRFVDDLMDYGIKWVIVKKKYQCPGGYIDMEPYIGMIEKKYSKIKDLKNYSIYNTNR